MKKETNKQLLGKDAKPMTKKEMSETLRMIHEVNTGKKNGLFLAMTAVEESDGLAVKARTYCCGVSSKVRAEIAVKSFNLDPQELLLAAIMGKNK